MEKLDKPYIEEPEHVKVGRFECTITGTYLGIKGKEVETLKILQNMPKRKQSLNNILIGL